MNANNTWAKLEGDSRPSSLADLLQYARGHYASHTDWYLKHRDSGFKAVAAAMTAEFAVVGFAFSNNIGPMIAIAALLTIMVLAILLTRLAIQSCTQAYKAAMEHAAHC